MQQSDRDQHAGSVPKPPHTQAEHAEHATPAEQPVSLLDLDEPALIRFFEQLGEPAYRAHQLWQWVHQKGVLDFSKMTSFSQSTRVRLAEQAVLTVPEVAYEQVDPDGTHKWLLRLGCQNAVETVFIPEDDRGTLCVSSQVGCGLNCRFCATAKQGFNRNLTVSEIVGQLWVAVRRLSRQQGVHDKTITNIVMMGMGEPLLNFDAVVKALSIFLHDHAYGLSKRRVTVSSSGLVPQIQQLSAVSPVALAISLHAPDNALRDHLVPINKKYPLEQLMPVLKAYFKAEPRRKIMMEYVMLAGVNDAPAQAVALARLLRGGPFKLNLIPFNTFPGTEYTASSWEQMLAFQSIVMQKSGIHTTIRKPRGRAIAGACGQLAGQVQDRTVRQRQWLQQRVQVCYDAPREEAG